MTITKCKFFIIILLGILIAISSFENELSAQENDQVFQRPHEPIDGKVNESNGALEDVAAIDTVHIATYDKNDKRFTYSFQRQWIYGRNNRAADHQSGEIDSGTSLRLQEDKDTSSVGGSTTPYNMSHGNTVQKAVTSNHRSNINWHLSTIKEHYALTDFSNSLPGGYDDTDISGMFPFLDQDLFEFVGGDTSERLIDTQPIYNKYLASIANDYHLMDNVDDDISDSTRDSTWPHIDSESDPIRKDTPVWKEEKSDDAHASKEWNLINTGKLKHFSDFSLFPDTTGSAASDSIFNETSIFKIMNQNDDTDSAFKTGQPFINSDYFSQLAAVENEQEYYGARYLYNGTTFFNQMESASNVKIFTIDTRGNIKGITGKILTLLP